MGFCHTPVPIGNVQNRQEATLQPGCKPREAVAVYGGYRPRNRSSPPVGRRLHEEIDRPLDILGGGSENLQRVLLKNIPCTWHPSPFTAIIDLALTNGVHLHCNRLIDFLRCSSDLQSIRLVNITFIGGGPRVLEETVGGVGGPP